MTENKDIEVGQVLSFKIRFNNNGDISTTKHPYVIAKIDNINNVLEVIQINSVKPRNVVRLAHFRSKESGLSPTFILDSKDPKEKVIDKDSFAQLDNRFLIEIFENLTKFRRQNQKLSEFRLKMLLDRYYEYHLKNVIDENKQVYISQEEFEKLNT